MRYEKCIGRCSTKILYVYADNIVLASGSVRVESSNGFKEKNEKKNEINTLSICRYIFFMDALKL